jgi:LacI family transcriptional regulator
MVSARDKSRRSGVVTITDVARAAGVSPMTVSRVVSGSRNVGEEARRCVLAAVKSLRYSPNLAGRSLRTRGGYKIGLLYSNPSAAYLNPLLVGALQQCSLSGSTLVIEQCGGIKSQRTAAGKLLSARVDGVILPPPLCDSTSMLTHLEEEGVPALAFATARPREGTSCVRIDDYEAARAITKHLIDLGHRDIGFIQGDPKHSPTALRTAGFLAVMSESHLPVAREFMSQGLFTYRSGLAAAQQLLTGKRRPTAIFSSNDDMAAAVVSIAHGLGLRVPEDLSVCGFDDTAIATIVWPELTTIHQPVSNMAHAAVALLIEEIRRRRAGLPGAAKHERAKFTLVKRASSARPARAHSGATTRSG